MRYVMTRTVEENYMVPTNSSPIGCTQLNEHIQRPTHSPERRCTHCICMKTTCQLVARRSGSQHLLQRVSVLYSFFVCNSMVKPLSTYNECVYDAQFCNIGSECRHVQDRQRVIETEARTEIRCKDGSCKHGLFCQIMGEVDWLNKHSSRQHIKMCARFYKPKNIRIILSSSSLSFCFFEAGLP